MIFQLNTPLLDGCVLAVLEQGDAYGYSLTQHIKREKRAGLHRPGGEDPVRRDER